MSTSTPASKKQSITLAQLSSYDDILTDVLVDHAYYWTSIPKNRPSYRPSRGVTEEEVTKIIQSHLIVDPDLDVAETKLLATDGLRRFQNGLKSSKEKDDFRAHLRRYMRIYLPDCPFEVSSTNRYTIYNHEAAITARKYIKKGQPIKYLSGIQVMITAKEDKELAKRKKDFSIVVSARNKCAALFMGPARFANHDCDANARLMITGQAGIEIVATRNIDAGDEITVSYAENYFGEDNCECLCRTCEENVTNGWSQGSGVSMLQKSIEDSISEGYSLRRRRRDDSCASGSRTPSVTPDIRPRIRKTKPRTRNGASGRESLCDSPVPHDLLREKRKREYETLRSPPTTPAKRLKTIQYDVEPIPTLTGIDGREDTASSEHSVSESGSSDVAVMTDVTTPDEETQEVAEVTLQSPALTPIKPRTLALMQEETSSTTDLTRIATVPPANIESTVPLDEVTTINVANPSQVPTTNDPADEVSSVDLATLPVSIVTACEEEMAVSIVSPENIGLLEQSPARGRQRERGRSKTDEETVEGHDTESTEEPNQDTKKRVPGDYTLTPVLLSEPNTAWIHCTICNDAFVQRNAYYTRSSCFRCERHSKLYGYSWPKTEREGPNDKEERVLDHRTIHRFLDTEEEARVRGRKIPVAPVCARPVNQPNTVVGKRGPGRPRKHPLTPSGLENDADDSGEEGSSAVRRTSRRRTLSLKAGAC